MDASQPKNNENFTIPGNWDEQSKLLKTKFTQLTDADLKFETGKENEMLGRIETRLNKNRHEVIAIIQDADTQKSHL